MKRYQFEEFIEAFWLPIVLSIAAMLLWAYVSTMADQQRISIERTYALHRGWAYDHLTPEQQDDVQDFGNDMHVEP
jgi:hypothetical protein